MANVVRTSTFAAWCATVGTTGTTPKHLSAQNGTRRAATVACTRTLQARQRLTGSADRPLKRRRRRHRLRRHHAVMQAGAALLRLFLTSKETKLLLLRQLLARHGVLTTVQMEPMATPRALRALLAQKVVQRVQHPRKPPPLQFALHANQPESSTPGSVPLDAAKASMQTTITCARMLPCANQARSALLAARHALSVLLGTCATVRTLRRTGARKARWLRRQGTRHASRLSQGFTTISKPAQCCHARVEVPAQGVATLCCAQTVGTSQSPNNPNANPRWTVAALECLRRPSLPALPTAFARQTQ